MRCLSPISLKNKGRDGENRSTLNLTVPCGRCAGCLSNRREEWRIRLSEEAKDGLFNYFITLTYDEDNIVYGEKLGTVVKSHAQTFIKNLRARVSYHKGGAFRFYLVAEYGTRFLRPHYHILMFSSTSIDSIDISLCWGKGNSLVTPCNERRISYAAKYHVNKGCYPQGSSPPFVLMSKGIGRSYIGKMKSFHRNSLNHMYYPDFRLKRSLPRYYKDRLYTKLEREQLGLLYMGDEYDEAKIKAFQVKHPGQSYFKDVYERYKQFQKSFKEKSNFNNQL